MRALRSLAIIVLLAAGSRAVAAAPADTSRAVRPRIPAGPTCPPAGSGLAADAFLWYFRCSARETDRLFTPEQPSRVLRVGKKPCTVSGITAELARLSGSPPEQFVLAGSAFTGRVGPGLSCTLSLSGDGYLLSLGGARTKTHVLLCAVQDSTRQIFLADALLDSRDLLLAPLAVDDTVYVFALRAPRAGDRALHENRKGLDCAQLPFFKDVSAFDAAGPFGRRMHTDVWTGPPCEPGATAQH